MLSFLGACYFLSVRQFLEAEKKIRIQTLIKFGHLSFKEACAVMNSSQTQEDTLEEARNMLQLLSFDFGHLDNVGDEEGILYFFAGFLARAESKLLKCESCIDLFVLSRNSPNIQLDNDLGEKRDKFLKQITRGGLFTPTDPLYVCVLHARQLYKEVCNKGEIENKFLSLENPQNVFSAMFELKMRDDTNATAILEQSCKESHKFGDRIKSIGDRVFNTFSKNFVGEIKDKIHKDKKRNKKRKINPDEKDSATRKIMKLQSDSK